MQIPINQYTCDFLKGSLATFSSGDSWYIHSNWSNREDIIHTVRSGYAVIWNQKREEKITVCIIYSYIIFLKPPKKHGINTETQTGRNLLLGDFIITYPSLLL